jgi:hypothetical protein
VALSPARPPTSAPNGGRVPVPGAPPPRPIGLLLRSTLVALGATSPACVEPDDLQGRDRSTFFQGLRAVWDQRSEGVESPSSREGPRTPARSRGILAFELDVAHAKGDTDQDLDLDDEIEIGGTTFTGPGDLEADSDVTFTTLSFRGGRRGPQVALEGLGGIAWHRVDLEVHSGGVREREVFDSVGPMLGAQITYEPLEPLALHARGTSAVSLGQGIATVLTGELGLALAATRRVRFFGAWRWWGYEFDPEGGDSDVRLKLSGPAVGLEVRF